MRHHSNEKNFKCNKCDFSFVTQGELTNHTLHKHTDKKLISCDKCDKKFKTTSSLCNHKKAVHTHSKDFKCDYPNCQQSFTCKAYLVAHQNNTHGTERAFSCDKCTATFKLKNTLNDHILAKHTEHKPYQCSICSAEFKFSRKLTRHLLTHSEHRPYKCDYPRCYSSFKTKDGLYAHIHTHSNERPFMCGTCNNTFKTKSDLIQHLVIHSSDRPFACETCGHRCKTQSRLTGHKKIHFGRTYNCAMCDKYYNYEQGLIRHLAEKHTSDGKIVHKKKEEQVVEFLKLKGIDFKREHVIDFKCIVDTDTYCRIDFVAIHNGTIFFLETDEYQHRWRSQLCETRRMYTAFQSVALEQNKLPIVFIRYNPDNFTVNDVKIKLTSEQRLEQVYDFIKNFKPTQTLSIKYFFYDTFDDELDILGDPEYLECLKPHIV